jgi:Icc-related predicted phosphoesterase
MQIVCLSDTHGQHHGTDVPAGDVLIHAGDFTRVGALHETEDFLAWYAELPHRYKIFIAGNHDKGFEKDKEKMVEKIPSNVIYLEDSGVEIEDIYFWGSPYTPKFFNWSFGKNRGEEIAAYWQKIPLYTNVLVTHGPPKNILDTTYKGHNVGCADLMNTINTLTELKLHVFGHIHEAFGIHVQNNCTFVNASVLDRKYKKSFEPVVVTV